MLEFRVPLCVHCRKRPVDPRWRPFCSERCKLFDLANWADGKYRVPGEPIEEPRDDKRDDEVEDEVEDE